MTSIITKSKVKKVIQKNSKRSSISDEVIEELDKIFLSLIHGIINLDNREIHPESHKTLKKDDIHLALDKIDDSFSFKEITGIEKKNIGEKTTPGRLLLDDQSIDINLNVTLDLENEKVELDKSEK